MKNFIRNQSSQNIFKRRILFFAKLSVSLGLVVYLLWVVDWERASKTLSQAGKLPILIAPFCLLVGLGAASFRWRLVLADIKVAFSYRQAYIGYLLGSFYSIFLPGVIGGDAIRVGLCASQTKCKIGTATASVLVERITGVFALLGFSLGVYLLMPATFSSLVRVELTSSATVVVMIGIIGTVAALSGRQVWVRWLPQGNAGRLWAFVRSGAQALAALRGSTLGAVLILSALSQAMDILATFLLSQAVGLTVTLPVFFAVIPLVYLATVLPISLGGLGVREGALVFLLSQFGVATSDAVTLSFLIYLNRVVVGALGGLVQLVITVSGEKTGGVAEGAYIIEMPNHRE